MRKIKEVIVVEGRYDKNALSQVVDATVITPVSYTHLTLPTKISV